MFQLIVAVISIVLIGVIVLVSIFYAGSAFRTKGALAIADSLVNGGQQLAAAVTLYRTETGNEPSDVGALVAGGYLTTPPVPPSGVYPTDPAVPWRIRTDAKKAVATTIDGVPDGTCAAVNKLTGSATDTFDCAAGVFSYAL